MDIQTSEIKVGENEMREVKDDEAMDDLCASVRRIGILQPLVVVERDSEVVLVAGHRRLRAAKLVGLSVVPVVVRHDSEGPVAEVAFAENLFRKDLSAVETAAALKDVVASGSIGIEELARGVHRSVDWVRKMVAMCDWPGDVLLAVHEGWLSSSAGSNVALVTDDTYRNFLLRQAQEGGATARTTAAWLQGWRSMQPAEEAVQRPPVAGGVPVEAMIPQLPCLCCGQVLRMDALSHVPVCSACVRILRDIRVGGVEERVGGPSRPDGR